MKIVKKERKMIIKKSFNHIENGGKEWSDPSEPNQSRIQPFQIQMRKVENKIQKWIRKVKIDMMKSVQIRYNNSENGTLFGWSEHENVSI